MKNNEINIRDPFMLTENGIYYMYGTRAADFGHRTGGFDVYKSTDLENWSDPVQIFFSEKYGMNNGVNWAPEVHRFNGRYYMFATFTQPNGNHGTFSLISDSPDGEFVPLSKKALTPEEWQSLDGTLYVEDGRAYLVFCHEHVQIMNGTVCYLPLSDDLSEAIGEPVHMFSGSDAYGIPKNDSGRYVTDGPFLYRGENGRLYLIWSNCPPEGYAQVQCYSDNGRISGNWIQLPPVYIKDGGHGMLFSDNEGALRLTLHSPNASLYEHPVFFRVNDNGEKLTVD